MSDKKLTQRERALKGLIFDGIDPELLALKHKARQLCKEFNSLDEWDERRAEIVKELLEKKGESVIFQGPINFSFGCNTSIGEKFYANYNLTVMDDNKITIGDHVLIGPNVSLMAASHPLVASEREQVTYPDGHKSIAEVAEPITIGNNVWLGCGVIVIGGVTIGDGAVIGAGSVVTHDIPAHHLACGVPCRVIREITEKDSLMYLL